MEHEMPRVAVRLPQQQIDMLRTLVELGDFPSVSEAIRAGVRDMVDKRCQKLNVLR